HGVMVRAPADGRNVDRCAARRLGSLRPFEPVAGHLPAAARASQGRLSRRHAAAAAGDGLMRETDVVIIGGGLAGSLAAAMLGKANVDTVIVDPHPVYPP